MIDFNENTLKNLKDLYKKFNIELTEKEINDFNNLLQRIKDKKVVMTSDEAKQLTKDSLIKTQSSRIEHILEEIKYRCEYGYCFLIYKGPLSAEDKLWLGYLGYILMSSKLSPCDVETFEISWY